MLLIHPKATVPIVQLSVLTSEDPAAHFRMGRALATLRDANIAIVGSGFASLHNMGYYPELLTGGGWVIGKTKPWNAAMKEAVVGEGLTVEEREARLSKWREFPNAYDMHPRGGAEHFLPLLVCVGAGGEGAKAYVDDFLGVDIWSFYWE